MGVNGAGIQVESGNWTKLHNQIWEMLATAPLSGAEFRCLMHLFRQTYGWQKKDDTLSMAQWAKATGLERRSVIRTVQGLLDKKVIYRIDNGTRKPATWGFNKYVETWNLAATSDKKDTSLPSDQNDTSDEMDTRTSDQNDTKASDQNDTHKRQVKKEKEKAATPVAFLQDRDDDKDGKFTMQLIRDTNLFGYFKPDSRGRASKLEESYTMDAIRKAVAVLVERHHAMLERQGKGVQDAVSFLAKILAEDFQSPASTKFVNVEVRMAPNEHYPNGCVKQSVMSYAKAKAGGYKIVEALS